MAQDNSNRPKSGLANLFRPEPYGINETPLETREIKYGKEYVFMDDSLPPIKILIRSEDLEMAYEQLVKITKHPADFKLEQTF